jgi:hypothetical protein
METFESSPLDFFTKVINPLGLRQLFFNYQLLASE